MLGAGVAGVALAVMLGAPAGATAPVGPVAPHQLTPIVECSVGRGGTTKSLFGYHNDGATVTVSIGSGNGFSPGPLDQGQPTRFQSGTRVNVFTVTHPGPVTWTLGGQRVRAPGPSCPATPGSSALAGWGPIAAIVVVTALLGVLLFWRTRRIRQRPA